MFGGSYPPVGWAFCDGSLKSISEFEALFSLIGTTYGGDGQTTFAVPDMRGRIPLGIGSIPLGSFGGTESVTITKEQLPSHTHLAKFNRYTGNASTPENNYWSNSSLSQYTSSPENGQMNPTSIQPAGGNLPHDNMMPSLAVSYIIAMYGVYPSFQ